MGACESEMQELQFRENKIERLSAENTELKRQIAASSVTEAALRGDVVTACLAVEHLVQALTLMRSIKQLDKKTAEAIDELTGVQP